MDKNYSYFDDRTGKRWSNQSVIALMQERSEGSETPQETVRRLARNMVGAAKNIGWDGPPFDVELLSELQGIEVRCAKDDIRAEARLMPLPEKRLLIEYSGEAPEKRRRFSICHEIAHTFFPDCYMQVQHRRSAKHFDRIHAELEMLCHVGAGELLMPLHEFSEKMDGLGLSFTVAAELAGVFNSSQEAAARRMVDLSGRPCCLVWLSERLKPMEKKGKTPELNLGLEFPNPKEKLRIDYSFPSAQWRLYLPKHKSIPDESFLYDILKGAERELRSEDWSALKVGAPHIEAVLSAHAHPESLGIMALLALNESD